MGTVYSCLLAKEVYAGGAWFYRILLEGTPLEKIDAQSPKELAQKLFELFRNLNLGKDARVHIEYPQRIIAEFNLDDTKTDDCTLVPIGAIEACKILKEFALFKGEVGLKSRQDARKVQVGNDGEWPS